MKKPVTESKYKAALRTAKIFQKNSHAPYSKKKVGSSVILSNGMIIGGCNLENASYGGTVCAERVALWKAKSEFPKAKIEMIFVVTDATPPWPPCGFCRQVMAEFCQPETQIICVNHKNQSNAYALADLLPHQFSAEDLNEI